MARAETRTLLPLDRWAQILSVNPLHFNQIISAAMPHTTCASVFFQNEWQMSDAVSRESIAHAIQEAENMLMDELQFTLLPTWQADERVNTVPSAFVGLYNTWARDSNGMRLAVQTRFGHFLSGGIEAKTLIAAEAAIVYSDEDGDGYDETATAIVATTVTEPCEIAVYYPGEAGASAWEIRPLKSVSIAGGVATIVMYRHQLVLPELLDAFAPTAVDGDVDANFLEEVDVYRHWNDPQQQVQLMWSNGLGLCGCAEDDCTECNVATQFGCLAATNYRLGTVSYQPAAWDTDHFDSAAWSVGRNADRLRLWYYAGYRDMSRRCPDIEMSREFERAVAYLSLTFLERGICGCQNLESITRHWREDLSVNTSSGSGSLSYQLSQQALTNPFGTTRGALFAWQRATRGDKRIGHAVKL